MLREHYGPSSQHLVCCAAVLLLLGQGAFQSVHSQDQRKEAAPVRVDTQQVDILFSADIAAPIQWDLLLPGSQGDLHKKRRVSLIDRAVVDVARRQPFRLFLFTQDDANRERSAVDLDLDNVTVDTSSEGENEMVRLEGLLLERDLQVVQTYQIPHAGHISTLTISLTNTGSTPQTFDHGLGISLGPGLGSPAAALDTRAFVNKLDEGTLIIEPLETDAEQLRGPVRWAGLQSRYYSLVLVPTNRAGFGESKVFLDSSLAESTLIGQDRLPAYPSLELYTESFSVAPGESVQHEFLLFAGPRSRHLLREAKVGLEDSIYCHLWRWLAALCVLLESVLSALHSVLGNWGVSIVVLALCARFFMFPISRYGIREQQDFQKKQTLVKPLLVEVKREYKGDLLKINEETLRIYKENGITTLAPLKGILPLMIQLPILFAFYQLLSNSYDLKGVSFLWIQDLSLTDRIFSLGFSLPLLGDAVNLLPILMFACHVVIARDIQTNSNGDPGKHKLSNYALPLAMFVLFYPFPAGCMLYWTIGSICQVFEQRVIRKQLRKASA